MRKILQWEPRLKMPNMLYQNLPILTKSVMKGEQYMYHYYITLSWKRNVNQERNRNCFAYYAFICCSILVSPYSYTYHCVSHQWSHKFLSVHVHVQSNLNGQTQLCSRSHISSTHVFPVHNFYIPVTG